ncbi:hypothetical protein ACK1LH_08040 [Metabacillus indicus]|uniref:Uncharacterized protein n=1 Tax=Metabacillus indicus TaxID=246786 RepID=A0A084H319_METID|nr:MULTISPECIES: hypothetical protein [Metabacillus]KEZ53981.1 hypothetical protein GS18_0203370 [Metabacillus indicus]
MDKFTLALAILAFMIAGGGLLYTIGVGRLVDTRKSEHDTQMNEKIQAHPYIRNPVFLACLIAAAFIAVYIFYLAFTRTW